jgi:hypothetical protein
MVQLPKREESTSEFVIPAEDTYTMVLDRLSEERLGKFPDKNGVLHPEQEFYFKILDDEEYEGCELRVYVRVDTFHDGSGGTQPAKVFLISKALLGASFDPNVPPDTEDLVGLKCRATVAHKTSMAADGTERTYANIASYSPMRTRTPKVEAKPVDVEPEDDSDVPF